MAPQSDDGSSPTEIKNSESDPLPLTSGFRFYPKRRDENLKCAERWMKGKAEVDGAYPYWRIHDKLYDMTPFMDKHPGGKFWLEITQGTDITESFESSHFGPGPEKILAKHFVKDAPTPRNSPFTFEKNGFYRTLKNKVTPILAKAGRGPSWHMLFIQDSLFIGFLIFFLYTALYDSVISAIFGGALACFSAITSHNFFHQRDNWRMYIFNVTILSQRDWRITHAISHHLFPNTIYDYEISGFEPFLEFLPRKNKGFIYRHFAIVLFQFFCIFGFYIDLITKAVLICVGEIKPRIEYSMPYIQIGLLMIATGSASRGFWLWFVLQTSANTVFLMIGFTAAHHHPDIYHEGDISHSDKDWGLHQIAATRERKQINSSLFIVAITFGNHTLHHLFPTVDHSKLPLLMPAFLETCREFGVKFEMYTIWELCKGAIARISNIIPNSNVPKCFK